MKTVRKIINMDYRKQSAETFGMFAEANWPRNDETISHQLHRKDKRVEHQRDQRIHDSPIHLLDKNDLNTLYSNQGRRCW